MATSTTAAPNSFPFTRLPGELRNQIWQLALSDPAHSLPQLCFYNQGCWDPQQPPDEDAEFHPHNDEMKVTLAFFHDRLDPILVEVPLFFVNREARSFALAWIHEHGIQIRFDKHTQSLYFVPLVDPRRDVLYIPKEQFDDFLFDPSCRLVELELGDWDYSFAAPEITRLALPATVLWEPEIDTLRRALEYFPRVKDVFVIFQARSEGFWSEGHEARLRQRWVLEDVPGLKGPIFIRDEAADEEYCMDPPKALGNYGFNYLFGNAYLAIGTFQVERFEMQHAVAVRRL
ncbi:hypothetical protein ABOM_002023 [Aspergillus bombycis]|uniref:2EXR domain-containing protein n=1 Tax=Aspergillus bombycis TaxID=109264 RepID=A0A1F8AAA5_9EURO|nr:hypothetical protein ABOM_002023 [Aspergillus bombycis]OGM48654.1 hypothetical protein ABOM_002023 [Aspergillus bombycis]